MATTNISTTSLLEKNDKRNRYCWQYCWHLIKKTLIGIEKLNSRQIYSLLEYRDAFTPTSQKYFNGLFKTDSLDWKQIYLLPRLVTLNSYSPSFQYQILNNLLYLKKTFYLLKIDFASLSFLLNIWRDSAPSILQTRYNSKCMKWPGFILRKRRHSIWSNTVGCLFRFP